MGAEPKAMNLGSSQKCIYCNNNSPALIKVELLCHQCAQINHRGKDHLISKAIRGDERGVGTNIDRRQEADADVGGYAGVNAGNRGSRKSMQEFSSQHGNYLEQPPPSAMMAPADPPVLPKRAFSEANLPIPPQKVSNSHSVYI